ncbi:4Fe-4S dicluster domain-containing protein [termite gut metagenome]|uniref:4Fe-4S dicluster domain-containing protein n=1 Tax=termite gut metagenome TaxID=433724 RepID=A0A5J4T4N1_9ZZZZ
MLKTIRVVISAILFGLITFFFLDFAGILPNDFHWLANVQFVPALLSHSFIILGILLALTLLFGRIFCSTLCPMGVFQDVVAWFSKQTGKKKRKKKYKYSPAKTTLRYTVLGIALLTFVAGFPMVLGWVDPYSVYGRMATHVFRPVYMTGNNLLESVFSSFNNYTFYRADADIRSLFSFFSGIVMFLLIGYLAWKHGRICCNTICPVGTVLGLLSKYSLFKIRIDADKCNKCGLCAMKCKAACIDSQGGAIDHGRCVDCYNCLETCQRGGLSYSPAKRKKSKATKEEPPISDQSKRRFLLAGVTTGLAAAAVIPKTMAQKGTKAVSNQVAYKVKYPVTPPGAVSIAHFQAHCTSCHLCVSKCPSKVLRPAFMEYGWGGIMQPVEDFEKGFCNYDCTICGEVCPNGAIRKLTVEEKHLTQPGRVVFIKENCVVYTDETSCGACSEHCPTQAVSMVPYQNGLTIPKVDTEICVGCGGCEHICPVIPYKAIHIEGNPVQLRAKPFIEEEKKEINVDNFGF